MESHNPHVGRERADASENLCAVVSYGCYELNSARNVILHNNEMRVGSLISLGLIHCSLLR